MGIDMKKILMLTFLLISTTLFANENEQRGNDQRRPELCYTSGECQVLHPVDYINMCVNIKTGWDASGKETCVTRCALMPQGFTCEKAEGKEFGACIKEKMPAFSALPGGTCYDAIDESNSPF
jgi:hypothetical protein